MRIKTKRIIWKDVIGYEGMYKVSDTGLIKSMKRVCKAFNYNDMPVKECIRKSVITNDGYLCVNLSKNGKVKQWKIHQLVAIAFLGYDRHTTNLVTNHKNFIRTDNRVENLEIITQRENSNKKHLKSTSKYVGVNWHKDNKRWVAQIVINGKHYYLGSFLNEKKAAKTYAKAVLASNNNPKFVPQIGEAIIVDK